GAVAADVVEAPDLAVVAAQGQHPLAEEVEGLVVARLRDIVQVAHHLPRGAEHRLPFALEEALVGVEPGGQRLGRGAHARGAPPRQGGPGQPAAIAAGARRANPASRSAMIASASAMIRSISCFTVGTSWIRPATMPQLQPPASMFPSRMIAG